tara:strand:+ start:10004 stop:10540 length:537 start_codon:yes stop_codon:yes gene_type:complete
MKLNEKLATIQTKFKSKKSRFNSFGKYYFRSAEDILEAIKPYLLEHGITVTINEELINDNFVIKTTATISDGMDAIHATAIVGVDISQKGMQMPQRFGSASSYGKKYALGNLFLIDDTQDSDATNDHGQSSVNAKQWLNKGSDAFDKAIDYVKAGGKVNAIKQKYSMNKEVEAELSKI